MIFKHVRAREDSAIIDLKQLINNIKQPNPMQKQIIATSTLFTLSLSCDNSIKSARHNASTANKNDTPQQDSAKHKNYIEKTLETIPENLKPVFGYRFILTGDFDGDGKMEKLLEHFFSGLDNKMINTSNDTLNKRLEKELTEFKGLVKKIRTNKIQVIFKNGDAMEDTATIDLKRLKYKGQ